MILATITLTLGWWIIPVIITLSLCYFLLCLITSKDDNCFGMLNLITLLGTLTLGATSWAIYLALRVIFGII